MAETIIAITYDQLIELERIILCQHSPEGIILDEPYDGEGVQVIFHERSVEIIFLQP